MAVRHMDMPTERVVRRLCAILAADVAGYSQLMGGDEDGTLAALTAHRRELIDPAIVAEVCRDLRLGAPESQAPLTPEFPRRPIRENLEPSPAAEEPASTESDTTPVPQAEPAP